MRKLAVLLVMVALHGRAQDAVTPLNQAKLLIDQSATAAKQLASTNASLSSQLTSLAARVSSLQAQLSALQSVPGQVGSVNYYQLAGSNWDSFTGSADLSVQHFISTSIQRFASYTPYFDDKLSWMPNTDVYIDSYGIYANSAIATQHPDWILVDSKSNKLYIPWGCSGGTCPQYAGDVSNPAFRAYMVQQVLSYVAANDGGTPRSYKGIFLDDVNMIMSVSNGNGDLVAPQDRATRQPMTQSAWQAYFVAYLTQIRQAIPTREIVHNSVWYAGDPTTSQSIAAQMVQADIINIERGYLDSGITGGSGQWALSTLMAFIDHVHSSVGKPVVIENYDGSGQIAPALRTYALSCYFLTQALGDYIGFNDEIPTTWGSTLYSVKLGPAKGPRFKNSSGVWERDFLNGRVYVNEPGTSAVSVAGLSGLRTTDGVATSQITLGPKQGIILLSN